MIIGWRNVVRRRRLVAAAAGGPDVAAANAGHHTSTASSPVISISQHVRGGTPMARDPVCGMDVYPEKAPAKAEHGGVTYYFCCPHCASTFAKNPAQFVGSGASAGPGDGGCGHHSGAQKSQGGHGCCGGHGRGGGEMRMARYRWALAVLLVALVALSLSGCGGQATPASGQGQTVKILMAGMKYQPQTVTLKTGQAATLQVENNDTVLHDLTIAKIAVKDKKEQSAGDHNMGKAEPDVHVSVAAGRKGSIQFTPTSAGKYEFVCTEPGHKDAGMRGTLVVE